MTYTEQKERIQQDTYFSIMLMALEQPCNNQPNSIFV